MKSGSTRLYRLSLTMAVNQCLRCLGGNMKDSEEGKSGMGGSTL